MENPCPVCGRVVEKTAKTRLLEVRIRPLLVSGGLSYRVPTKCPVILIDSEQSQDEQLLALWHEIVHLIRSAGDGPQDEESVEAAAIKLAAACPEALDWIKTA